MSAPNNKRKRLPTSPDKNTSFVQRVTGLIPEKITRWFKSTKSDDVNLSTTVVDTTGSSTCDENVLSVSQPTSKRMRFTSPGEYSQFNPVEPNGVSNNLNINEPPIVPHSPVQSLPITSIFRHESSIVSSPVMSVSDESLMESNDSNYNKWCGAQHEVSTVRKSVATKRQPIFKSKNFMPRATPIKNRECGLKRPSFKRNLLSSIFYPGKTTYGGASSSYMNLANIKQKKVPLVKKSEVSDTAIMSYSARHILDLLENYSSPLSEARRLPQYIINSDATSNAESSSKEKEDAYKTQELYIPNIASVMHMKRRSRLMGSTSLARQLIASHSSTIGLDPDLQDNTMQKQDQQQDILSIKNQHITDNSMLKHFTTSTPNNIKELKTNDMTNQGNLSSKCLFKFKNPDLAVCDFPKTLINPSDTPEQEKDNNASTSHSSEEEQNIAVTENVKDLILTNMLKEWKCSDCWVNNKPDIDNCICCGGKRPTPLSDKSTKCVVCNVANAQKHIDKCVNCEKNESEETEATNLKSKEKRKFNDSWVHNEEAVTNNTDTDWKCDGCSIWNKYSLEKCVTCGSAKVIPKANNNVAEEPTVLTDNDDSNKNNSLLSKKPTDEVFTNIVKSQKSDTWQCSSCLINNVNEKSSCVCCGVGRGNVYKIVENKTQFNFDINMGPKFKFGIFNEEPQEPVVDNVMEEESLPEISESIECVPNNNILLEMPTFSHNYKDKIDLSTDIEEASKDKFELPKDTLAALPMMIVQTPTPPSNSIIEKEKPQNLPNIDFGHAETNKQKPFFYFCSPKSKNSETSQSISFMGPTFPSLDKKTSKDYLTLPAYQSSTPATSSQISPAPNTFRFSSSKLNLSGNPFENSVSTTDTTNKTFIVHSQNVSTATVTSPISLFSKPESNTTNSIPLFSKKDTADTAAKSLFQTSESTVTTTQSAATAAPIFNFWSNQQNNTPQVMTEKSKFNFVFKGNTSDSNTTSLKPAIFGTMPNSNPGSHIFTLPPGNTLGAATGLFGNPLPGNGLSTGNTLTVATLPSSNSLVGNADGPANTNSTGNELQTNSSIPGVFGTLCQRENMWSNNNISNNMFVLNSSPRTASAPVSFTFGAPPPCNPPQSTFSSSVQANEEMSGMSNQCSGNHESVFSNRVQNQSPPMLFENSTSDNRRAQSPARINGPSNAEPQFAIEPTPTHISAYAPPAMNPTLSGSFNFSSERCSNMLSFGQPQVQQTGVYNFGGKPVVAPQVQFNMGSSSSHMTVRRVRKAVRRSTQR